ncbi:MAG: hypothetical protein H6828_03690 [Planctomycetes bacterium]|nr:hypothetical protein [Planctomycetota bacterium]
MVRLHPLSVALGAAAALVAGALLAATRTPARGASASTSPPRAAPVQTASQAEAPVAWIRELPCTLDAPGAYRLAPDFRVVGDAPCVTIVASGVHLDLGGAVLDGGGVRVPGVRASGALEDVRVRRGELLNFVADGVDLASVHGARLEALSSSNNAGHGIVVGDAAELVDCQTHFNYGGRGVVAGDDADLRRCRATHNEYGGFVLGARATLVACEGSNNLYGAGVAAGAAATLVRVEAHDNDDEGLRLGAEAAVVDGRTRGNLTAGVRVGPRSVVRACEASETRDGPGFALAAGAELVRSRSVANHGPGAALDGPGRVAGCALEENRGGGLTAVGAAELRSNALRGNRSFGLRVRGDGALLVANDVSEGAGPALWLEGRDGTLLANHVRGEVRLADGNATGPASGPWANRFE